MFLWKLSFDLTFIINNLMILSCFQKTRYQQLNKSPRKYSSFTLFFSLLFVIAVLNLISPCDGRGGNIFSITYAKLTGTYNNTYAPLTEPFVYTISDTQIADDNHIRMTIKTSSVSKITCVLNETNVDPGDVNYKEGKDTRFYIRTQTASTVSFKVNYLPGVEQRLFCKISGLLYKPYHVEYYQSTPFNYTCITCDLSLNVDESIQMKSFHQTEDVYYFTYVPKGVSWTSSPPQEERVILCRYTPLNLNDEFDDLDEKNAVFVSRGELPLSVFGNVENARNRSVYCGWFIRGNSIWKVAHVDVIPIH